MTGELVYMPPVVEEAVRNAVDAAIASLRASMGEDGNVTWFAIAAIGAGSYLLHNAVAASLPPDKARMVAFSQLEAVFTANEAARANHQ
jgi:hypothetical protein